jgi:uncharacterized membrane protein YeiH
VTFVWYRTIYRLRNAVLLLDAAGLALFAVSGTQKALVYGASPVAAALMGMLTGIGGGMLRDVLAAEIPAVLKSNLYAVAALAGAAVVVTGHALRLMPTGVAFAGAAVCFGLRCLAIRRGWQLPKAYRPEPSAAGSDAASDSTDESAGKL